ncbi:MAG: TonB-dependent receptor plug domain-containing protein [Bacteroidota bacterium]
MITGITVIDDETGDPLIGVNIYTEDQSFITATDIDGRAEIPNIGYKDPIIISYTGYREVRTDLYQLRKEGTVIRLMTDTEILQEVVVVGRRDDPEEEIPYIIDRIDAKEIQFTNAQTTVDAINKNGDVFIQKSQMGGGSPILRGFEANKVLLVLDGVRLNNAIYRSGHLQNAITVDNSIMEQIEVIHGPGSLLYGSDALGGVVHFRTKDPKLLFGDSPEKNQILNTNIHTRFSSANLERSYHLDFNYGTRKVGWLFSSSYNQYGDLMAGRSRCRFAG